MSASSRTRREALGLFVAAPAAMAAFAYGIPVITPVEFGVAEYVATWRALSAGFVPTISSGQRTFSAIGPFTGCPPMNPNGDMIRWEVRTPDFAQRVHDYLLADGIEVV